MNAPAGRAARRFALAAALLAGCGEPAPLRVGFLGGVSGRVADLGVGGRNGAQLAVEAFNALGGINGRPVELLTRDDEQDPELARRRFAELADAGVAAVVGPMTSGVCAAVLPDANARRLLLLSPTCTAKDFGGKDDYFMRVISPTVVYAEHSARYQYEVMGMRKLALIYDLRNHAYSESWGDDFRRAFGALGGRVVAVRSFASGDDAGLAGLVESVLKAAPDGVVLVANSVDAALLVQQIRRRSAAVAIATAEWSSTERFIELAGKAADEVVMAQFLDRDSTAPAYQAFRARYRERFGDEPGFAGVAGYDATTVLLEALRRQPGRSPKEALLAVRRFDGLQGPIEFDANGDADRRTYVTRVRNGRFVVVPFAPAKR